MILYVGGKVAFAGNFSNTPVSGLSQMQENELTHCRIEIIENSRLYKFENKDVFPLEQN